MNSLLHNRWLYISITLLVIAVVFSMMSGVGQNKEQSYISAEVEAGPVRQLVSVSGIAEANQSADLAFSVSGLVKEVLVRAGDRVETGDTLVILDKQALLADRQEAAATLESAIASRLALLSGPTETTRNVTDETLITNEVALQNTQDAEAEKIKNAYRTLLSSGLTAYSKDGNEDAVAPTVSGTYTCDTQGTYKLEVYASQADSGYSYRLSGIETGTFPVTTLQPSSMGDCGLRILFDSTSTYGKTAWVIEIPNTKSSTYTTNKNAYDLAVTQAENAIAAAEQALALAKAEAENKNAPARSEDITKANAVVAQARARLNRIDATLTDRTLTAPFSGTITDIDIIPGETVTTAPIITLLAESNFEVTARIPEIDIGKLLVGQRTELLFDAKQDEVLTGVIRFISLKATEIDGVAYYEAFITLDETPAWMRSGLNADIEIIITETPNELRIPRRFLSKTSTGYEVLVKKIDGTFATSTVELVLEGNDGFVAITGLNVGDTVIAP